MVRRSISRQMCMTGKQSQAGKHLRWSFQLLAKVIVLELGQASVEIQVTFQGSIYCHGDIS